MGKSVNEIEKLEARIKELECELAKSHVDVDIHKSRRERADELIDNIKCALLDPNYEVEKPYGRANTRAIFVAIRNLHRSAMK